MRKKISVYSIIVAFCCLVAVACSSDGDGGGGDVDNNPETGSLSLSLMDVPTDLYRAVYIKIDEIQVYLGGDEADADNWQTVSTPMKIYSLLDLVNGVREELDTSSMDTGAYQQMRLIFGTVPTDGSNILGVAHPYANYVIDLENRSHKLNIPSAVSSGSKVAHDFIVSAGSTTELILDFNASASVVQAGTGGNWLLMPDINVLNMEEYATVSGIVSWSAGSTTSGVTGARVTLQSVNPGANDPKDMATTRAATVSDEEDEDKGSENGEYVLFADPGSYRLVSYKDGFDVECAVTDATTGQTTIQDIELATAATGMVEGNVIISGGTSEQYATLSFRRSVLCEGAGAESTLEVRSLNIAAGYYYQISLPVGTYSLVASGTDMETVEYDGVEVTDGDVTYQNVSLAP